MNKVQRLLDRHAGPLVVLAVFLLGVGIRVWGMGFGLPYLYHPDEPNNIEIAQRILQTGDLNPHFYHYSPFYFYLNAAAYLPYVAIQLVRGVPPAKTIGGLLPLDMRLPGTGFTAQPLTVLIGRAVSVVFGSLCVVLVYLLAMKMFRSRIAAGLAALFVAVSPELAAHSRVMTPDTLVVFFCVLNAYYSIDVLRRGNRADYMLAGAAGALAASAKYGAAVVLVVPALAHVLANGFGGGLKNTRIWLTVVAAVLTFVLLNPPAVLYSREFYSGITSGVTNYATGHAGMEGGAPSWYLGYFWWSEGLIAVLGLVGMIVWSLREPKEGLLLAAFPVVYFCVISSLVVRNDRTAIPITPFLYLFCVGLLSVLWKSRPANAIRTEWVRIAVLILVGLMLAFSTMSLVQTMGDLLNVDARETSRVWIEQNIDPGAKIGIEAYDPYLDKRFVHVTLVGVQYDLPWYQQHGFDYVILSRGSYGRFFREPELYKYTVHDYKRRFSEFELVKIFDDTRSEPWIYRLLRSFRDRAQSAQFWDGFMEIRIYRVPPVKSNGWNLVAPRALRNASIRRYQRAGPMPAWRA